jgi:hypothetical protein
MSIIIKALSAALPNKAVKGVAFVNRYADKPVFYVGVVLFGRAFCKKLNTDLLHNILGVRRIL